MNEHLNTGMYVRVPIDGESALSLAECRDYRIGQVILVNESSCTVMLIPGINDPYQQRQIELSRILVRRCRLLANAPFFHTPSAAAGTVLIACEDAFSGAELQFYYALLNGEVCRVSEADIPIEAHAQAPDPGVQISEYEFHPLIWKTKRDQLLQSYIQLRSATFGMEELVGSRILLLPHQAETIARVLSDRHCRYVLADEVGLGKTIEACVILKGLRQRNPDLKTLIIAPHTLTRQWYNELNRRFWLEFSLATAQNRFEFNPSGPGILISIEDLQRNPRVIESLLKQAFDLLIINEAHRLERQRGQYDIAHRLSAAIEHCLILSATPILRHAAEYLSSLRLMHPQQYDAMSLEQFEAMLSVQSDLRRRLAYVGHTLNETDFDLGEFRDEIGPLVSLLQEDHILPELFNAIGEKTVGSGLGAAHDVHSYLSENYRIENRVIRNRRASLEGQVSLPNRALDDSYSYVPTTEESEVLADLTDFAVEAVSHDPQWVEIVRVLYYVAASSPYSLQTLVETRHAWIGGSAMR